MQSPAQALLVRRWPRAALPAPARYALRSRRWASTAADTKSEDRDRAGLEDVPNGREAVDEAVIYAPGPPPQEAPALSGHCTRFSIEDGAKTGAVSTDAQDQLKGAAVSEPDSSATTPSRRSNASAAFGFRTATGGRPSIGGAAPRTVLSPTQQRINAHILALQAQLVDARRVLADRAAHLSRRADAEFGRLGGRINEVTGYREVEAMKVVVVEREHALTRLRDAARAAKEAYDSAVTSRSDSQREVTSLLERKHAWTDADVASFTTLVRRDHASNLAVSQAKLALAHADVAVEQAFDALMKGILERYHEEQVWSDKIRSVSTYGSLVVLGINLVVFLGAIIVVEPWKRRRLVRGLEERMTGMMSELEGKVEREVGAVAAAVRESGRRDSAAAVAATGSGSMADTSEQGISPLESPEELSLRSDNAVSKPAASPAEFSASHATPSNALLDSLQRVSFRLSTLPGLADIFPAHVHARDALTAALLGTIGGGVVVGCGMLTATWRG